MQDNYLYCNFTKEVPESFEEFYKSFLYFVEQVRMQGDQLYEMVDSLTDAVDKLYEGD